MDYALVYNSMLFYRSLYLPYKQSSQLQSAKQQYTTLNDTYIQPCYFPSHSLSFLQQIFQIQESFPLVVSLVDSGIDFLHYGPFHVEHNKRTLGFNHRITLAERRP